MLVMIRIIIVCLISVVVLFAWFRYFEWSNIFFPEKEWDQLPASYSLAYEDVALSAEDGTALSGWYIPSLKEGCFADSSNQAKRLTVLFCHGNGGNISHRMEKMRMLEELGCNIFIFDYRGYGKSKGRPSEKGLYRDAHAAFAYLVKEKSIAPQEIIVYGESLGGAVAVEIAAGEKVAGLILEGTFTSIEDMARRIYPFLPRSLIVNKFDVASKINSVRCPVLIMHSEDDEVVPAEMGRSLYEKASGPKRFLSLKGGHNESVASSQGAVVKALCDFVSSL